MGNQEPLKYMESLWNKINDTRKEFKEFISYEWNYFAHLSFHKNYETKIENVEKLVKRYFDFLRNKKKLTFSAFYIIPKSRISPVYNPHHIHSLFLLFNPNNKSTQTLKESAVRYDEITSCEVHHLSSPEAGINYLSGARNFKLTDYENVHFDFYREQLLKKYRNDVEFINTELMRQYRIRNDKKKLGKL
jgi:hypothetical protein